MNVSAQSRSGEWTSQKSADWFLHGQWRDTLRVKPHPSINRQEFAVQYHADEHLWNEVFAFLNRKDLVNLDPGKYPIAGDSAYAMISEFAAKKPEEVKWESHRKYIDIHYVIQGKEKIGVAPVATATVTEPYDAATDAAHYTAKGKYYTAVPGQFFIFFPGEAHRPDIMAGSQQDQVKKLVIKVMVMGQ